MKRHISIFLIVLVLLTAMLSAFSVFAEEGTPARTATGTCTADKVNIASEASVGYTGDWFFAINEALLNDGDKDDVIAHSPKVPNFSWILNFGKPYEITNVDLYINGTGRCSICGGEEHASDDNHAVKSVQITLYDDLGTQVYKSDVVSTISDDKLEEEVFFPFDDAIFASKIEIAVTSNSYGSAYFREVEVYTEAGEHNWVLDEATSTPASCTQRGRNYYNCECGARKEERTNAHTVTEWTVTQAPTTTTTGIAEGPCTVSGCGGTAAKILPRIKLEDSEFRLTLDKLTFTEDLKEKEFGVNDEIDYTKIPRDPSYPEYLFDGIIESTTWNPENIWCGTGWTEIKWLEVNDELIGRVLAETIRDAEENVVVKSDSVINEEALEKIKANGNTEVKVYDYYHSTLKIDFDQVYTLTMAELYVFSTYNNFTVDFLDADGNSVKQIAKRGFEYRGGYARLIFTGDVYGLDVKSVLITVESAKWPNGKGLAFTEFKLGAHECSFAQEDIDAGTTKGCVTEFDGKCLTCTSERTDAKIYNHTYEKDSSDPTRDKVEVVSEANCYLSGYETRTCTTCSNTIGRFIQATGEHSFTKEIIDTQPTCIDSGLAHKECSTVGCTATDTQYSVDATGWHIFTVEVIDKAPSCFETGLAHKKCATSGCTATDTQYSVDATGEHDFSVEVIDKAPSCFENGFAHKKCSTTGCTATDYIYSIDATGEHDISVEVIDKAPDCASDGLAHKKCSTAGCTAIGTQYTVPSTGDHAFVVEIIDKAPSCFEAGLAHKKCSGCDATDTQYSVDATGNHNYDSSPEVVDKAPNCFEVGIAYKTCTTPNCGWRLQVILQPTGEHDFSVEVIDKVPDCASDGLAHKKCSTAGCTATDTQYTVPSTGDHAFIIEIIDKVPSCFETGLAHKKCSGCDATNTQYPLPLLAHTFRDEVIDKAPSCFEAGVAHKECVADGCNAKDTPYAINPTGAHDFSIEVIEKAPDCINKGLAHKKCSANGCTAISTPYPVDATGVHTYTWQSENGMVADLTHSETQQYACSGCKAVDTSKEAKIIPQVEFVSVYAKGYSVRYTDYISPRATFGMDLDAISDFEENFEFKIYAIASNGIKIKEILIYGEGASGIYEEDGTFSLVVKNPALTDAFDFHVRVEIKCKSDNSFTQKTILQEPLLQSSASVSVATIVSYYTTPSKIDMLNSDIRAFYESISRRLDK
ncbi:MAG: hypothetical protein J6A54_02840 [Clostridia bacterium]|nr:hypothetical protein [Clostridia bacterium]